jgi:hypothetical protein
MKNYISNIIALPGLYRSFRKGILYQKQFMQDTVGLEIEHIKAIQDGSLTEKDFKRITDYYGYAVPAILGEGFSLLRGIPMTMKERHTMTYLGSMSSLFDDFFDEKNTSLTHIQSIIDTPQESLAQDAHELLFIRFYLKALEHSTIPDELKQHLQNVYDAELLSKQQTNKNISIDQLKYITIHKGGVSFLLYRSGLGKCNNAIEEKMIYLVGGLSQVENDLFDIYKDYNNGITTLATIETNINHLRTYYNSLTDEIIALVHQTDYALKNKLKFIRFFSIIASRGLVCFDYLERNEAKTDGVFSIEKYSRKELICDMEKPYNALKVFHYYAKCKTE